MLQGRGGFSLPFERATKVAPTPLERKVCNFHIYFFMAQRRRLCVNAS